MTPSSVSAVGLADVSNPDAVAGVAVAKVNAVAIAKKESTVLLVAFVRCIDDAYLPLVEVDSAIGRQQKNSLIRVSLSK